MGVVERTLTYYNHISIIFFVPLVLLFFLAIVNHRKINLLYKAFVSNKYFYDYPADQKGELNWYNFFLFLFILWMESVLFMYFFQDFFKLKQQFLGAFFYCLGIVVLYNISKYLLHYLVSHFDKDKLVHKQMLKLETSYLVSVLMIVYPLVWVLFYEPIPQFVGVKYLLYLCVFLYVYRIVAMVINSKNLLSGKAYYIFLYLCALEIIPLVYTFYSIKL